MSGLIYAVLFLIWAAVLIPMWLRRNDDSADVNPFSSERVLVRRPQPSASERYAIGREVLTGAAASEPELSRLATLLLRCGLGPVVIAVLRRRERVGQIRPDVRRRRRVLGSLLTVQAVVLLAAAAGAVPAAAPLLTAVPMAGYLELLRRVERSSRRSLRSGPSRREKFSAAGAAEVFEEPQPAVERLPRLAPETALRSGSFEAAGSDLFDQALYAAPEPEPAPRERTWSPRPLPLPMYVTARQAAARSEALKVNATGTRSPAAPAAAPAPPAREERRAVNG